MPDPWVQGGSFHPRTQGEALFGQEHHCHLASVPVLSVALSQDAGSQQIGFLLGSCGVTVALTSDACHKGLPKSPTGEIPQFKGEAAPCQGAGSSLTRCVPGDTLSHARTSQTPLPVLLASPWRELTGGGSHTVDVVLGLMETPEAPPSLWWEAQPWMGQGFYTPLFWGTLT